MMVNYFFEATPRSDFFRVHFCCGGYNGTLFIPDDLHTVVGSVRYYSQVDLWEFSHDADPYTTFVGVTREEAVEEFLNYVEFNHYVRIKKGRVSL